MRPAPAPAGGAARTVRAWRASPVLSGREAEARVVGRVADQQDRRDGRAGAASAMRVAHQRRTDAGALQRRIDRERSEQQRTRSQPAATSHSLTVPTTTPSRRARRKPALPRACGRGAASPTTCACGPAPWRGRAALRARRRRRQFRRRSCRSGVQFDCVHVERILHPQRLFHKRTPQALAGGVGSDQKVAGLAKRSFTSGGLFHKRAPAARQCHAARRSDGLSASPSDHVGSERLEAVEGDRRVGRRVGAGTLDQHLVADGQR